MTPINEVYPDCQKDYGWHGPSDYSPMLRTLGEVILQVDDDNYSGDSRVLYKEGERWGILIFGWGSCSGCDALQACDSYSEIEEFRKGLVTKIQWFPSRHDCLAYIENKDWSTEFYQSDETKSFVGQATQILKEVS